MNKLRKVAIISTIVVAIISQLTYTTFAVTGKITAETVRIRKEATTESKILEMGNIGETVEIIEQDGDWYKVKYNGTEGYIYKDYLETTEEVKPKQEEQPVEEKQPDPVEEPKVEEPKVEEPEKTEESEPVVEEQVEETKTTELGDTLNKDSSAYIIPNYTSETIFDLKAEQQVKVITTLANWAKIDSEGKEAWIPKTLLMKEVDVVEPSQPEEPVEEKVEEPIQETVLNEAGYITSNASSNMREGPSTDTASLAKLPRHTKITIIGESGDWYKVSYNGKEGYISKQLVAKGEPPAEETSSRSSTSRNAESNTQQATTYVAPAPSSAGASSAASIAANYVGCSYVYGGSSPSGFDCSGFTSYCYAQAGMSISRTSYSQASGGTAVSKADLQPGDIVVFSGASHVGIYVGDGQFIHAANPSQGVRYDSLNYGYWAGQYQSARRY